jgi:hypothetical protein
MLVAGWRNDVWFPSAGCSGSLNRLHPRKAEVRILNYVDREVPVLLRMFEKRLRAYRAIGYARDVAPWGFGKPDDATIADSQPTLPHLDRGI